MKRYPKEVGEASLGRARPRKGQRPRSSRQEDAVSPTITIRNKHRRQRLSIAPLHAFARSALPHCLSRASKESELLRLREVCIIILSDLQIAKIHREFMNLRGPTDVITFQHGEILLSADTAAANARRFGTSLASEVRLYLLHGLLHLAGFDDKSISAARRMRRIQDTILAKVAP